MKGRLDDAAEQKIAAMAAELEAHLRTLPNGLAADLVATMLGMDFEVRVDMLGLVDVQARCERLERALRDVITAKGLPTPVPDADGPITSKALVRRPIGPSSALVTSANLARPSSSNGAAAARVPEDIQPLVSQLEQRQHDISPSALAAIQRELARLGKIPAQSAEYGVVKTYIELLLALPWDRVSEMGEVDLERAKEVLERDHEGLKEVKTRVIEYLAVYK
jgi:ATP-dependent Lon protease